MSHDRPDLEQQGPARPARRGIPSVESQQLRHLWRQLGRPNPWVIDTVEALAATPPDIPARAEESYSQCGEDLILMALLRARYGTKLPVGSWGYVDIGANHAVSTSNTWLLYRQGARGLLLEPNRALGHELRLLRPGDQVISGIARTDERSEVTFHETYPHELSGIDEVFFERIKASKGSAGKSWTRLRQYDVPAYDVNRLISDRLTGKRLVLLCIDAEGADLAVLQMIDLATHAPDFIVIEPSDEIIGVERGSEAIEKHLGALGYRCAARTRVNMIFERR